MTLSTVRVLELAGAKPFALCGRILANFGAQAIRVSWDQKDLFGSVNRGKQSPAPNLKTPEGAAVLEKVCLQSDALRDPFSKGAAGKGKLCQIYCRRIPGSSM